MGLSQSGCAEEQEVRRALAELVGKIRADVVDHLHVLPDGDADVRVIAVRVPVCGEGVKALVPQVQHPGQLLLLLPGVIAPQAAAHPAVAVARVPAEGAGGRLLQSILRQAHLLQKLPLLCLEAQIFIPQHCHRGPGVRAVAERTGDDAAHGGAKLPVDLPQAGAAGIDGLPAGSLLRFPDAAVSFIPFLRQTQKPSIV